MKKIISLVLVTVIIITALTSCTTMPVSEERSAELEAISATIIEEFFEGDFSTLIDMGTAEIKAGVSPEDLTAILESLTLNEDIKQPEAYSTYMENMSEVVQVLVPASTMKLLFMITYSFNDEIAGFFITKVPLTPEAVTNDIFTEEPIEIMAREQTLSGMLTIPNGVENPPVAVIISGSGPQGMDGVIGSADNAVYRDIAHGLAEQGVASIRYNDRFYPLMANDTPEITIEAEVIEDVASAISIAKNDDRLGEVFLIGHSLGGMLSPYIIENSVDVNGFVSLAGSPRKLEDIIYSQNVDALDNAEITGDERDEQLDALMLEIEKIKALEDGSGEAILGQPAEYWYSLNQVTGEEIASNINYPALILQGSEDFQVKSEVDFADWQELLAGNENVQFKEYEGLNHLFMTSQMQSIEDYNIPNNVDETVIADIADFIKAN